MQRPPEVLLAPMRHVSGLPLGPTLLAAAGCGRAEEPGPAAAPRAGDAAKASAYVIVPTDSPRFKQLRVEPVRLADVPEHEMPTPAR